MKKSMWKSLIFICIFTIGLILTGEIVIPKFLLNNDWPTTVTYKEFYDMEEDTVDVIFLGSSAVATSYIPQELYNRYGIRSFNLGCEQQNLVMSYYWLKEALRYHKLSAVVLDCNQVFTFMENEILNCSEELTRKAMDNMKFSKNKMETIHTICSFDSKQTRLSYVLPIVRFHTRWKELCEDDFTVSEVLEKSQNKGYTLLNVKSNYEYKPLEVSDSMEQEEMQPVMKDYLDKIVFLCRQNNIDLILVNNPSANFTIKKHNTVQQYADENRIEYCDFNEACLYNQIQYQFDVDNADIVHANLKGAVKQTDYIGTILPDKVKNKFDEQWEKSKKSYELLKKDVYLQTVEDVSEYLELIKDDRYTVIISVRDEATKNLNNDIMQKLRCLGLQINLSKEYRCSYYAVISDKKVSEELDYIKLEYTGKIRDGRDDVSVISAGWGCGDISSVKINGNEYSKNGRGLNIVVYNNETRRIIDSVCFDTCAPELNAYR